MAAQVVARKSAEESLFELCLVIVSAGELACRGREALGEDTGGPWPGTPAWRRAGGGGGAGASPLSLAGGSALRELRVWPARQGLRHSGPQRERHDSC